MHRHRDIITPEPLDAYLHALHLRTLRPVFAPAVPSCFVGPDVVSPPDSESFRELVYRPVHRPGPEAGLSRCVRLRFVPPEVAQPFEGRPSAIPASTSGSSAMPAEVNTILAPAPGQLERVPDSTLGRWDIAMSIEHKCSIHAPGGCVTET